MSEEEKEETTEEAPAEEAPEETAAEAPAEEEAAPAEEETPAEEAPAEESPADGGDQPTAATGGDDEDDSDWKARRRLEKSRREAEAKPERSPEERQAEREAHRAGLSRARRSRREKARQDHQAGTGTPPAERVRTGKPKERQGTVVSNRADKTITVRIDTARRHPVYEKIVRQSHKIHAHDEQNEAAEGDVVRVVETRKLSKTKHWKLVEIVERAR
jgi:small subunit ribosomal protein S17